jgi:hypothetical protein
MKRTALLSVFYLLAGNVILMSQITTCMNVRWLFNLILLFLSAPSFAQETEQRINQGIIDLRKHDFEKNGEVRLDGTWNFYWKQLLTPEEIADKPSKDYFEFPSVWNNQSSLYKELDGQGYATYVAEVLIDPSHTMLSVELPDFYSSYKLWINGKEVAANGTVGKNRDESEAQWRPRTTVFQVTGGKLQLVLQVSNFQHQKGGSNDHIYLGLPEQLFQKREKAVITNIILFGGLGLIGFFFLILFFFFRSERAALYFAAICLTWAIRSLFNNLYLFIDWFPSMDWELAVKVEYLTLYLTMMWSILFVSRLFPEDTNQKIKSGMLIINSVFILITLATPAFTYTRLLSTYLVVAWMILAYVAYVVVMAILDSRKGAWFSAISILLGVVMFSYDLLTHSAIIDFSPLLFSVGYIVIFMLNATAFAYQLSQIIYPKPDAELSWS